jgi:hypothetical protein
VSKSFNWENARSRSHPCRDRYKEEEKTLPVAVDVLLGKLDADGEYANGNDDASKLESNALATVIFPRTWVEDLQPERT